MTKPKMKTTEAGIEERFLCAWDDHDFEEVYYGWKCSLCGLFFADGCAPWDSEKDDPNEIEE